MRTLTSTLNVFKVIDNIVSIIGASVLTLAVVLVVIDVVKFFIA